VPPIFFGNKSKLNKKKVKKLKPEIDATFFDVFYSEHPRGDE
jgi:hypothetical protein